MKQRIFTSIAALLCALTLFATGIAPVYASAPPSDEGGISAQSEEVCWYFRTRDGVREMRLWSITNGRWITDWVPVPEGWLNA